MRRERTPARLRRYMTRGPQPSQQNALSPAAGVTLVELIISMLIISIALAGVLSVMNFTTGRSADPMIQHQAIAIAEAYMEEILLHEYENPPGGYTGAERDKFDDVEDYNGLHDTGATDLNGNSIGGLISYTIDIAVSAAALNGVDAHKITVTVTHPAMGSMDLVGYRTDYD